MQSQKEKLFNQLAEHGWRVAKQEEELEWWADEIWRLESLWSPVGSLAYVTFLVDPMSEGDRTKGEDVWAVMASPTKPASHLKAEGEYTLSLSRGWSQELPIFFHHLATLRVTSKGANSA